jgi:uncharacterized protein (DUF924 family)
MHERSALIMGNLVGERSLLVNSPVTVGEPWTLRVPIEMGEDGEGQNRQLARWGQTMTKSTRADAESIESILEFWFGDIDGIDDSDPSRKRLWWMGHPDDDAEIRARFSDRVDEALGGGLDHWTQTPRGTLALVLLLDQFTRVIGRGTPAAFSGDAAAQWITLQAIDGGVDQTLRFCERSFLYMPLMHAEDPDLAERSLAAFSALERARAEHRGADEPEPQSHAVQHADIVKRFGRYPHRNAILGRAATPEEEEFLAGGGPTFGQKKK